MKRENASQRFGRRCANDVEGYFQVLETFWFPRLWEILLTNVSRLRDETKVAPADNQWCVRYFDKGKGVRRIGQNVIEMYFRL